MGGNQSWRSGRQRGFRQGVQSSTLLGFVRPDAHLVAPISLMITIRNILRNLVSEATVEGIFGGVSYLLLGQGALGISRSHAACARPHQGHSGAGYLQERDGDNSEGRRVSSRTLDVSQCCEESAD